MFLILFDNKIFQKTDFCNLISKWYWMEKYTVEHTRTILFAIFRSIWSECWYRDNNCRLRWRINENFEIAQARTLTSQQSKTNVFQNMPFRYKLITADSFQIIQIVVSWMFIYYKLLFSIFKCYLDEVCALTATNHIK